MFGRDQSTLVEQEVPFRLYLGFCSKRLSTDVIHHTLLAWSIDGVSLVEISLY
jgi:hypothetical protein